MTVSDLIDRLEKFPEDATIGVATDSNGDKFIYASNGDKFIYAVVMEAKVVKSK